MVSKKTKKKHPQVLRIGVDLDACVVDLTYWISRLFKRRLGINIKKILGKGPVDFWLHEWPEVKKAKGENFIKAVFQKPFIYEYAKPVPGAIKVLNKWRKQGHQIWIITARPEEMAKEITFRWLKKNKLGWTTKKILFTGHSRKRRAGFKSRVARELDLHAFIEDHAETVRAIDSPSLIVKLVLKYPWNMAEKIGRKARFVEDWQEIDRIVQEISS
jgi:uncharacterized HAD superfamily protein